MAITFPTSLDSLPNPTGTDLLENATAALDHDVQHSNANDAIEALEAKVGVDGSAVTTSHDYKLSGVTGSDKAVSKTGTETLTNKTLTSPTITGGTVSGVTATTTSVNGVTLSTAAGTTTFLRGDGTYTTPTSGDATYAAKGSVQGLTDAATSGLTLSSGVISVNSGTGANNIVKLDASAKLPAVDGSQLTNTGVQFSASTDFVSDSYYTYQMSAGVNNWSSSGSTTTTLNGSGYNEIIASGAAATYHSNSLPGAGSSVTYNITTNKILRIKFRVMLNNTTDRTAYGFTVTPSSFYTANTDVTNGNIRFIADGATLYAQNSNGTSQTSTNISTGVTLTNWNNYEIVFTPGTSALFYVNGTLKATHTTNLPSSGVLIVAFGMAANNVRINTTPVTISIQN